jgi:hypothetical protein
MEELINQIKMKMVEKDQPYLYCLAVDYHPLSFEPDIDLDGEGEFRVFISESFQGFAANCVYIRYVALEEELYFWYDETEETNKSYDIVREFKHNTFDELSRYANPEMLEYALKSILFYLNNDDIIEACRKEGPMENTD